MAGKSVEEKVFLAAAEAMKTAMSNLLVKKQYPTEKWEFRKRTRNSRKLNSDELLAMTTALLKLILCTTEFGL